MSLQNFVWKARRIVSREARLTVMLGSWRVRCAAEQSHSLGRPCGVGRAPHGRRTDEGDVAEPRVSRRSYDAFASGSLMFKVMAQLDSGV
jgi:hypothetical protein